MRNPNCVDCCSTVAKMHFIRSDFPYIILAVLRGLLTEKGIDLGLGVLTIVSEAKTVLTYVL